MLLVHLLATACTSAPPVAVEPLHTGVTDASEGDSADPETGRRDTGDTSDTAAPPGPLQVVFVVDITGSWARGNMANMRTGLVAALDALLVRAEARSIDGDRVALVSFHGRYANTLSPWTALDDPDAVAATRAFWATLETASKGGTGRDYPQECLLPADYPDGAASARNQFPTGGCYPHMPREYTDEPGTDFTTGLTLAGRQFSTAPPGRRAVVLVTDGVAGALAETHGAYRGVLGYTETRWEEYSGPVPRSVQEIEDGTLALAEALSVDEGADAWIVAFATEPEWLSAFPKGDGYAVALDDSAEFERALTDIVDGL